MVGLVSAEMMEKSSCLRFEDVCKVRKNDKVRWSETRALTRLGNA
jgi:hypothetical protein